MQSKEYRLGHMVLFFPRKMFHAYKRIKKLHPIQNLTKQLKYATTPRRIAFFAMESYHFDVVENMLRICNPQKNYIIAYVHPKAHLEISRMLGEMSKTIEWHTYSTPNLKRLPKKEYSRIELLDLFRQDIVGKKNLDYVILPSPEYHADWYMELTANPNRHYKVIAGVHNLNTIFSDFKQNDNAARLFEAADEIGVIDSTLKRTIEENGWSEHPIRVFPQIYSQTAPHMIPTKGERITFVITGAVDKKRKDYQSVINALRRIPERFSSIRLVLLGKADNEYALEIVSQLDKMTSEGLEVLHFQKYVPIKTFREEMFRADYLFGPIVIETDNKGIPEFYGKTKISGIVGDMIRYARPALLFGDIEVPDELKSSVIQYRTEEDLAQAFIHLSDRDVLADYCNKAQQNSEKFLLQYYLWDKDV